MISFGGSGTPADKRGTKKKKGGGLSSVFATPHQVRFSHVYKSLGASPNLHFINTLGVVILPTL